MRTLAILSMLALVACGERTTGPTPPPPTVPAPLPPGSTDLKKRLADAYVRAADWLAAQQDKSGAWMQQPAPDMKVPSVAYTGLVVSAFADAPTDIKTKYADAVKKGCEFLVSKQNKDGSFGEGPTGAFLKTYTSAIALMALSLAAPDGYRDAKGNARGYLNQHQLKEGVNRGGSGYGDDEPGKEGIKKTIANLSTTGFTAEGMHRSGLPQDDEFWKLVVEFVRRCQNSTETNTDKEFVAQLTAKGMKIGDDGGLYYAPVADPAVHKAGTKKIGDKDVIVSYGSMTYEGIKTYIYAGLKKDSREVKAAVDWVRKNWNVEAHPGFPYDAQRRQHLRGLFYYYTVMARAMDVLGENPFQTIDGQKHDWAAELGEQLLKIQKENKMWQNENPGWMESDPLLVTSYVLNAMNAVMRNLK